MKTILRVLAALVSLLCTELYAGSLKVTLTPSQAVSAGAQWRVDGGTWRNSGTTVNSLSNTTHQVQFKGVSGWITPATVTVTITSGNTKTLSAAYVQAATLRINLTPSTGQWRVDGGAWRASGTTATGLAPGNHAVDYASVAGYASPVAETVNLTAAQTATLARSYTQLARLTVSLAPGSGQWRVDGGAWQSSGATVANLSPGSHAVAYSALAGYASPPAESVTLTNGQILSLNRSFIQLAQLSITLTPSTGQWNVDDGAWQPSGATVPSLTPGTHTINYSSLPNYVSPDPETVSLAAGQSLTLPRNYTQFAQISIDLVPATGQWRANESAWQPTGSSLLVPPGECVIEYSELVDYDSPESESILLSPGESFTATRYYTTQKPTLRLYLTTPINGPWPGQWRIDGGAWRPSGARVDDLTVGAHTLDYTDIGGPFNPLPSETISLAPRENVTLTRAYALKPRASLTVTLDPTAAQWRVDGGAWQPSGATVGNLPFDYPLSIDYAPAFGYMTPASESVTLASGQALSLDRSYVRLPQISITLTPATGPWIGQWRVDGGAWQVSGATVANLTSGAHTITYLSLPLGANYQSPPAETVSLSVGQSLTLSRSYTKLAAFYVILDPASARWRIDGGIWSAGGIDFARYNLSLGTHLVEYSALPGYVAPPAESVTLISGANPPLTRSYTQLATFGVTLNPTSAQWRIDGGGWNASGAFFTDLAVGTHTIEYSTIPGYITPPADSVTLVCGINPPLTRSYTLLATFGVTLNPTSAQWRIDGGGWNASGAFFTNLALGAHTVEYSTIPGYVTPPADSVILVSGINQPLIRSYTPLATFGVNLTPASAQWRFVGAGVWNASGAFFTNIPLGTHTIEYFPVPGYVTPPNDSVTLVSGINQPLVRNYDKLASVHVTTTPSFTQWRIDGGTWWPSGPTTVNNLAFGVPHIIEFSDLPGYVTPPAQTVTLSVGELREVTASYTQLASLSVSLDPTVAMWRIDGGNWINSGNSAISLTLGAHTVEYGPVDGFTTPPAESVELVGGLNSLTRSYAQAPSAFSILKSFENFGASPVMFLGQDGRIYGAMGSGGNRGAGTVFKMNRDGSGVQILHNFPSETGDGLSPTALFEGSDGLLYGTTNNGGVGTNNGTLFKINKDGSGYVRLRSFATLSEGSWPNSLLEGSNGILYGTTVLGGTSGKGVIFRANKDGSGFAILRSLTSSDGYNQRGLIEGPGGLLYGVTGAGGASNNGTLYHLGLDGSNFTVLKDFAGTTDGSAPRGGLLLGSDGLIYGTTSRGGAASNSGLVFRIGADGAGYQVLYRFLGQSADGGIPQVTLTEDANGNLYGSTFVGGSSNRGTLFRMKKDGSSYSVITQLTGGLNDGGLPNHKVLAASDGTLYSSTGFGGAGTYGLIFKVNQDGSNFAVVKQLGAVEGFFPSAAVTVGNNNIIYGTTYSGGANNVGTVFRINQDGTGFAVLHHFAPGTDGGLPLGRIIEGSDGLIYGTTSDFSRPLTTLFRMNADGTNYVILHSFGSTGDGNGPQGIIEASDGLIYGTTSGGGTSNLGTVFRINKDGTGYTTLRSFAGGTSDGQYPYATVVEGTDGRLYGTTEAGGSSGLGTAYVLNKNGTGYSVLRHFGGGTTDGATPYSELLQGSDGLLYGTTSAGGANGLGTVFKLQTDGTNYGVIKHFLGGVTDGAEPYYAGVVERNNVLYGVSGTGGSFNAGVIYSLNKDGSGYQILINFGAGSPDSAIPAAGLSLSADGILYGTTAYGGTGSTVFKFRPN